MSEDKTGTCPVLPAPTPPCVADVDECDKDYDCVKDKKCCSNGCYKICVSPSIEGAAAAGILFATTKGFGAKAPNEIIFYNCLL